MNYEELDDYYFEDVHENQMDSREVYELYISDILDSLEFLQDSDF